MPPKVSRKPRNVAEYLAALDDDKRAALAGLRKTIRTILPRAEEVISYGMPGFRQDGHVIVWIGASKNHCAFFPGASVQLFADELADFAISKGTVRFQPGERIPTALVRKMIKARIAAIADKRTKG